MNLKTVKAPEPFAPLFEQAETYVRKYFENREENEEKGTITIGGERYILVRAASLSVYFLEFVKNLYPALDEAESIEAASKVLFDIAHNIGKNDAKAFHKTMDVTDPIAKLSTGPVHFSFAGWAYVDILEESKPSPDENYYLIYDHPQSFEADSWLKIREKTDFCTCFMNSGYSSGWCEESFSIELNAKEILCRAKGDPYCRFIMAPDEKLGVYVDEYRKKNPDLFPEKND